MSFIYPRTVSIRRVATVAAIGDRGYSAQRGAADETALYSGVTASVQATASAGRRLNLPSDPRATSDWMVMIPRTSGIPLGALRPGDVIVDESRNRYDIHRAYWTILGWQLYCTLQET